MASEADELLLPDEEPPATKKGRGRPRKSSGPSKPSPSRAASPVDKSAAPGKGTTRDPGPLDVSAPRIETPAAKSIEDIQPGLVGDAQDAIHSTVVTSPRPRFGFLLRAR